MKIFCAGVVRAGCADYVDFFKTQFALQRGIAHRAVDLRRPVEVLDGPAGITFSEENAAQQQVRLGIVRLEGDHALRPHGSSRGIAFKKVNLGDAEHGVRLIGIDLQRTVENLTGLVQMKLLKTRTTIEKQQGQIVRRLLERVSESG